MRLYCGIDLHSTNSYVVITDETDKVVASCRVPNDLNLILEMLAPFRGDITGVVVESTYNWYWLVDGLKEAGYEVRLANPSALVQYSGLKYVDDRSDARWLAHLLRLGILPEGYIYPRAERGLRDLLRRRMRLVQHRTSHLVSLKNLFHRNTGQRLQPRQLESLDRQAILDQLSDANVALSAEASWQILECLNEQIHLVEKTIHRELKPDSLVKLLLTVAGVGKTLAPVIRLETGSIGRFASPGKYVSYCRGTGSRHHSNGKPKGKGNTKNGNPYLSWAFVEAANFAVRSYPPVKRFYERKKARTHRVVALKAIAHKLARASYYVMHDQVPFRIDKAFG